MADMTEDISAGGGGRRVDSLLLLFGLAGVPRLMVGKVEGGNGVDILFSVVYGSVLGRLRLNITADRVAYLPTS